MPLNGVLNTPRLHGELDTWAALGLIPEWDGNTMQDEVIANVLRVIRQHLELELEREYDGT